MTVVRVQTGHFGRTSGATGAYNPRLKLSEADMNHWLAVEVEKQSVSVPQLSWQFVGPDERIGDPCHLFVALHMDGSNNASASGPSVGYPPGSVESKRFGDMWKEARLSIPGALPFRSDNYTAALSGYYGHHSLYSGSAPVKIVIENGFVTNDSEAQWAQAYRPAIASALIATVSRYYGLTGPTPIDNKDSTLPEPPSLEHRIAQLERKVERTTQEVNPRQGANINRLFEKIADLAARIAEQSATGVDERPLARIAELERFKAGIKAL